MFGIDTTMIVAAFAAIVAFIVAYFRRGEKIRKIEDSQKAQGEVDEIIEDIRRSVPSEFYIDRVLGRNLPTNSTTDSKDRDKGSL